MAAMTPDRVFLLGDSISVQYGPHLEAMLAGRFTLLRKSGTEAAMQNLDIPQGANGGNSKRCLTYLTALRDSTGMQADLLLLNCGLHDVLHTSPTSPDRQVEPDDYRTNLERIIAVAAELGVKLTWIRTTPVNEQQHNDSGGELFRFNRDVDLYNQIADAVMTASRVPMIDLHAFSLSLGPTHETLHDGRHFIEPIQRLQAAYIAGYLHRWQQQRTAVA